MNTTRIAPTTKLRRGSEQTLNGKSVWVERDPQDGTIFICDDKSLHPEHNFWWVNKSDLQLSFKINSKITAKPKPPTEQQKKDTGDLNSFFDSLKVPFNCMCCRKPLYAFNKKARRAVSCHLLPKSIFDELATDVDNIVFMGVYVFHSSCNDHPYWDASVESRMKMTIYPLALKRYQEKLRPKLSEAKQQLADEYMGLIKKSGNLAKDIAEGKA